MKSKEAIGQHATVVFTDGEELADTHVRLIGHGWLELQPADEAGRYVPREQVREVRLDDG